MTIPILNQRHHKEREVVVRRSDGTLMSCKVPKTVDLNIVKRAFADLKAGRIPEYLTESETLFMADVIGFYEEQDEKAKQAEQPQT